MIKRVSLMFSESSATRKYTNTRSRMVSALNSGNLMLFPNSPFNALVLFERDCGCSGGALSVVTSLQTGSAGGGVGVSGCCGGCGAEASGQAPFM